MCTSTNCPKILIVGRVAWTINESTLLGLFGGFPADRLAYICIETREPDYTHCQYHFQISEVAMLHKLVKWRTKTGRALTLKQCEIDQRTKRDEESLLRLVRAHRSIVFLYLRELLWRLGGWKSNELKSFVRDFHPDAVFCIGDPMPLMIRLARFIIRLADVPASLFMMDDIYTYTPCHSFLSRFYRWKLRNEVIPLIHSCKAHFAISPKMKRECDRLFGTDCVLLTKGIEVFAEPLKQVHSPVSIVYTGNLLYGRLETLVKVAQTVKSVNDSGAGHAFLKVFSQTELDNSQRKRLLVPGACQLFPAVPYADLVRVYDSADIVLFVESLEEKNKYIARLSFSTKLTDYLASGRCIFAIGAEDIAPMEYLSAAGIGVVCNSQEEIEDKLTDLLLHQELIYKYARDSSEFGKLNHSAKVMHNRLANCLYSIVRSE